MCTPTPRRTIVHAGTALLWLTLAAAATAQTPATAPVTDIHRLGGTTAMYKPALKTVASVQRMAGDPAFVTDLGTVLEQAGLPHLADRVVTTLVAASPAVMGGYCTDADPADGTVVECDVRPGDTLRWMAYRPKGGAALDLLEEIRWAGSLPFKAFLFRVTEGVRTYTFVIPKVCGNVSLMAVREQVPAPAVAPVPPPAPAPVAAPPPPPPPPPAPVARPPADPMPPTMAPPVASASPFFIDLLAGKDRRVRPIDGPPLEYAQCSPLIGLKVGLAKRFENDWELAGGAGLALSLVTADDKVREHELFVDVEANRYIGGGAFVGTGLSLWDLAHSDTLTPAWMLHVGLPLTRSPKVPVFLMAEGRVFLDHADDVRNNYLVWGGVRIHFR